MIEGVYMTQKETKRAEILMQVIHRKQTQEQAAIVLEISLRQVQRLCKLVKANGISALASKKRGKTSNRKLPESIRTKVSEIILTPLYMGFGPTFMCEKLEQYHNIKISRETTRQLMIQNGVWSTDKKKRPVVHQQRQRRARAGELVQIDSSPHAWFEERGEQCDLVVFIDDATGHTYGKFFDSETTAAYMQVASEYIKKYGKPIAFYSDKHGIFRINQGQSTRKENYTQLGRALKELEVELIYANSPQAKGRVERANQTLQDRLIKEMRLRGISTIEEANEFLKEYWNEHNKKFSVAARCPEDAHRPNRQDLSKILCIKEERTVSKNLEFQFENEIYQVKQEKPYSTPLAKAKITVIKKLNGEVSFEYRGKPLVVEKYGEQRSQGPELNAKELSYHFKARTKHKLSKNHPWRRWYWTEAPNPDSSAA
jgi:hypothetical protein